jgi:fructose-specific phosphotransferase system IIA component
MILADSLNKNSILVKVKSKTRWELIEEMLNVAEKNKSFTAENKKQILKGLVDREKSMSTGIGNGVAIPHCTTTLVQEMIVVMAISQDGIDFAAIDNNPVKIAILLLVPKNKLTQHIKTLANIAKIMSNVDFRKKLLTLKTSESILKEIQKHKN